MLNKAWLMAKAYTQTKLFKGEYTAALPQKVVFQFDGCFSLFQFDGWCWQWDKLWTEAVTVSFIFRWLQSSAGRSLASKLSEKTFDHPTLATLLHPPPDKVFTCIGGWILWIRVPRKCNE